MNILIYGATGYIGNKLSEHLLSLGYSVGNVGRRNSRFDCVENYLFDDDINEIISTFKPDKIIYMTACFDNNDVSNIVDINIKKPLEILKSLEVNSFIEFIYIGSYWQFGNKDKPNIPIDLYSATKSAIVSFLDFYNEYSSVSCKEIVLFGTYGESDGRGKLLDYLIEMSNSNKIVSLTEGYQELNLVHVKDVCMSIEKILQLRKGKKFQVLSKVSYTPRDLVRIIQKYQPINVEFGKLEYRSVELMRICNQPSYQPFISEDNLITYIKSKLKSV
ncbi:NAD(P)-dependent oxidoreductase [Vibrio aestuarianus]|uniref:NAD-dependent epimerase/dehydratase family protein n=2 Tax=Vibrio aestuarianus TaxID=28171 RepID=UPI0015946CCE|nr:NAD(P)-dependent oxidoreductase [Vibrio aestuarianus]NGZ18747.1 NAD(P)-dependent oxidoreductase [Vibrio aestuarianus]